MREINEVSTEQIREASSKGFVASLGYRSIADNEFDYWLVRERHRVANLAIEKERKRIRANILDRVRDLRSCTKNDNCQEFGELIESYIEEWIDVDD